LCFLFHRPVYQLVDGEINVGVCVRTPRSATARRLLAPGGYVDPALHVPPGALSGAIQDHQARDRWPRVFLRKAGADGGAVSWGRLSTSKPGANTKVTKETDEVTKLSLWPFLLTS